MTTTAMSPARFAASFADGKAADALRTIGEVAAGFGIKPHVLRYWESQFPQLRPIQRKGGRRYYRPEDLRLIELIDRLVHRDGMTLRGAKRAIDTGSVGSVGVMPTDRIQNANDAVIDGKLREIRMGLAAALAG